MTDCIYRFIYVGVFSFFFFWKICYCAKIIFLMNLVLANTQYKLHVIICMHTNLPLLPCSISLIQLISPAKSRFELWLYFLCCTFNSTRISFIQFTTVTTIIQIKRMNWIVSICKRFLIHIFFTRSFGLFPRNEYCMLISAAKFAVQYLITVNKCRFD